MISASTTVHELLAAAAARLRDVSDTPRLDAELLLAHVLDWPRARLLAERQYALNRAQQDAFDALVIRREALEPVAYLVGHKEFYGLDFLVDQRVLVPRPETELVVEHALEMARRKTKDQRPKSEVAGLHPSSFILHPLRIADIGTGSGCIAVTLAVHLPDAQIQAVDLSMDALAVAAANVARHRVGDRVRLLQGDLLEPLDGLFDIIVSNPPYTILAEIDENVRRYEPHVALDGGPEGLDIYRRLLAAVPAKLHPDGILLLEIGAWQGPALLALACEMFPNAQVAIYQDLAGHDRVVVIDLAGNSDSSGQ